MIKKIAVLFGGVSAEHEVSVISGLQVLENIDRDKFDPYPVYLTKSGLFKYQKINSRKDFNINTGENVFFGRDDKGAFLVKSRPFARKIYIDAAYLAFHGGGGESGPIQGLFETLELPFTSPTVESSAIVMNKVLTKEVVEKYGINTVPWLRFYGKELKKDLEDKVNSVAGNLGFPVIVKPAHLGSSIGISVANTKIELKKRLLEAAFIDSEILVEKFIKYFYEYNCAVRLINNKIEVSEIERPLRSDEILSFSDKYQKNGNKKNAGMASLMRELPARISKKLRAEIKEIAVKVFEICRLKGMVRIDFMVTRDNIIYLTEVNPIPGSMAFYLWEASGITFTQQITDLIEQSFKDFEYKQFLKLDYESDILEKFFHGKDRRL